MKQAPVLAAVFLLSVAPAQAQQWQELGTYGGSAAYYYNPKTFSAKDHMVSAWTRKDLRVVPPADQVAPEPATLPPGARSEVAYQEFDCRKRQQRTLTGVAQENGRKSDLQRGDWKDVAAGSLDAALLDALCRPPKK